MPEANICYVQEQLSTHEKKKRNCKAKKQKNLIERNSEVRLWKLKYIKTGEKSSYFAKHLLWERTF